MFVFDVSLLVTLICMFAVLISFRLTLCLLFGAAVYGSFDLVWYCLRFWCFMIWLVLLLLLGFVVCIASLVWD